VKHIERNNEDGVGGRAMVITGLYDISGLSKQLSWVLPL